MDFYYLFLLDEFLFNPGDDPGFMLAVLSHPFHWNFHLLLLPDQIPFVPKQRPMIPELPDHPAGIEICPMLHSAVTFRHLPEMNL